MNWTRALIGVAIAVPVIALLAYGLTTDPRDILSTRAGDEAAGFVLTTLDGTDTVRLADYAGDVVVVNFWASWCTECRYEHDDLSVAARLYEDRGVRFLGLLFKDSPAAGRGWIEEMGGQAYPALWDRDLRTAIDFGLRGVPETFVIDRDGRVAYHQIGVVNLNLLRAWLEPLALPVSTAPGPAPDGSGAIGEDR